MTARWFFLREKQSHRTNSGRGGTAKAPFHILRLILHNFSLCRSGRLRCGRRAFNDINCLGAKIFRFLWLATFAHKTRRVAIPASFFVFKKPLSVVPNLATKTAN